MDKKDLEFAEAMKLKLRLNRGQQTSQNSEVSAASNEQSVQTDVNSLRISIIEEARKRHPGLTQQEVLEMMKRDGF